MYSIIEKYRFDTGNLFWVFISFFFCFILVSVLITPTQAYLNFTQTEYASLVFLPHGVRVLSIWLLRERAIVPLFIAHLFTYLIFVWVGNSSIENIALVLVGTFCVPLAIQLLRWTGLEAFLASPNVIQWRAIVLVGFLASIINSIGNSLVLSPTIEPSLHLITALTYIVGDTIGVIVVLLALLFLFRLYRKTEL